LGARAYHFPSQIEKIGQCARACFDSSLPPSLAHGLRAAVLNPHHAGGCYTRDERIVCFFRARNKRKTFPPFSLFVRENEKKQFFLFCFAEVAVEIRGMAKRRITWGGDVLVELGVSDKGTGYAHRVQSGADPAKQAD
jgi:hypothetical protein